ncbi:MAG: efflux RND transporter periplasmic adaptor subunit [Rhodothermaceae bacterium]
MKNKEKIEQDSNLSEIKTNAYPVNIEVVKRDSLNIEIISNGILKPDKEVTIISESDGKIISKDILKGKFVKRNQDLFKVESKLQAAELMKAEASLEKAEKDLERFSRLFDDGAISKRKLEEIKIVYKNSRAEFAKSKKEFENASIKSPFSGYINDIFGIEEGSVISNKQSLCELIDIKKIKIEIKLSPAEVELLKYKNKIVVIPETDQDNYYSAEILSISRKADTAGKFNVEMEIDNSNEVLRAGIYADVKIKLKNKQPAINIARKAIIGSLRNSEVYVIKNNRAELRQVKIGYIYNSRVEITDGLKVGEKVIINGQLNIKNGSEVQVVEL